MAARGACAAADAAGGCCYQWRGAEGQVARLAGFRKGLNATGYAEGQNATVEYHWLQGDYERLPALLADLVRRRVSVVATLDTPSALSTKNANVVLESTNGALAAKAA